MQKGGHMTSTILATGETQDSVMNWRQHMLQLGPVFAARAAEHDEQDRFVGTNLGELKDLRLYSAMVPRELGGGGLPYGEMSLLIQEIGRHCGSTALTFSMHQHLVAAAVW